MKEIYPSLFIVVNRDYLLLKLISGEARVESLQG